MLNETKREEFRPVYSTYKELKGDFANLAKVIEQVYNESDLLSEDLIESLKANIARIMMASDTITEQLNQLVPSEYSRGFAVRKQTHYGKDLYKIMFNGKRDDGLVGVIVYRGSELPIGLPIANLDDPKAGIEIIDVHEEKSNKVIDQKILVKPIKRGAKSGAILVPVEILFLNYNSEHRANRFKNAK